MKFELSVAYKYLIPRYKELSTSLISLISVFVISLIVWLVLVFFSVSNGMEKKWIEQLLSISGPVRLSPTKEYFESYYYQIDGFSQASDYRHLSIKEKLQSKTSDPYDPEIDQELPIYLAKPVLDRDGKLLDIVKETEACLKNLKSVEGAILSDFEFALANLRLNLLRQNPKFPGFWASQSYLKQLCYLNSFSLQNKRLIHNKLPLKAADINHFLHSLLLSDEGELFEEMQLPAHSSQVLFQKRLEAFFDEFEISGLKSPQEQKITAQSIPDGSRLTAFQSPLGLHIAKSKPDRLKEDLKRRGLHLKEGQILRQGQKLSFNGVRTLEPLFLEANIHLDVKIDRQSLKNAKELSQLSFEWQANIQGQSLSGTSKFLGFEIVDFKEKKTKDFENRLSYSGQSELPSQEGMGDGILLPKSFRESGALFGDRGFLSYYAGGASSVQEQRIPVYVAGFYDPGFSPGKILIVKKEICSLARASADPRENPLSNGFYVFFDQTHKAPKVRDEIASRLKEKGLDAYWKVEAFEDFDYAKDFIQQLRSDKTLFSLIAIIILLVACSNIVSMLILLVKDKKREIGILMSMGAKKTSIACIFAICGAFMGALGSLIGCVAAVITLENLHLLTSFLSFIQGYEAFNESFYGSELPSELSGEALFFVLVSTALLSTLAGLIPAAKAALLNPSKILREG